MKALLFLLRLALRIVIVLILFAVFFFGATVVQLEMFGYVGQYTLHTSLAAMMLGIPLVARLKLNFLR